MSQVIQFWGVIGVHPLGVPMLRVSGLPGPRLLRGIYELLEFRSAVTAALDSSEHFWHTSRDSGNGSTYDSRGGGVTVVTAQSSEAISVEPNPVAIPSDPRHWAAGFADTTALAIILLSLKW
ncbi:hypothetical protein OG21DRAFT_1505290 [Imleria badia]|nr:hypothetical protein OG21DRAFT_1505290 [Imleria badia]